MASIRRRTKRKLGEILVDEGFVTQDQVQEALAERGDRHVPIGALLVERELVTERDIARAMVAQFSLPYMSVSSYDIDPGLLSLVPLAMMRRHEFVPVDRFGDTLVIACAGVMGPEVIEEIERTTGTRISLYVTMASEVAQTLEGVAGSAEAAPSEEAAITPVVAPAPAPEASAPAEPSPPPSQSQSNEWEAVLEKKEDIDLFRELEKSFRGADFAQTQAGGDDEDDDADGADEDDDKDGDE